MQELSSERLFLGQLLRVDEDNILSLRSDQEVNRFLNRAPMKYIEEACTFIEKIREGYSTGAVFYWAIRNKKGGPLIGTICLWNISEDRSYAELGYEMLPQFQRQGFMFEAVGEVIRFAFDIAGMKELAAHTTRDNLPSIHLLRKYGFTESPNLSSDRGLNLIIFRLGA